MLKAIVMDFDGLIIDTEVVWYQLYKKWFLKEYNYALSIEKFLVCVGADSNYLFDELKQQEGIHVDAPKLNAILGKQFIESSRNLPAKPGVERLIKKAKQNKLQLILATSASRKSRCIIYNV